MKYLKLLQIIALGCLAQSGFAQFAKEQVAGFYHFPIGQFQITALYDGQIPIAVKSFQSNALDTMQTLLDLNFINSTDGIQTSVNAYLVNTGKALLLIDSGAAACFGDKLGSISSNLHAAGYQPEQIDMVLLTHLHPDHACGISAVAGKKSFPNAVVYVNQKEADFWLDKQNLTHLSEEKKSLFTAGFNLAQKILEPYQATQQFKTYQAGDKIVEGIEISPSYGHTVGHTSYLVKSGKQQVLILGDTVHNHLLQFKHPTISFVYDYDSQHAIATRQQQFKYAAQTGTLVAGAHLPFPGIGHIKQIEEDSFVWLPMQFDPNVVPETD